MIVYPNAKINIGLDIVKKRSDGFHNIESVFYPVTSVYDLLEIIPSEDGKFEFSSSGIDIPGDQDSNLCIKAFQLLKQDFPISNVKIHLHKNIPVGAGLGGGSSDAAFTLRVLNELFKLDLTIMQLLNYARKLGSDCAFFIENKPVYAYGKGDEFQYIELNLSAYEIRLEYPNIHIGTSEAYSGVDIQKPKTNLNELINNSVNDWKASIKNNFEHSIFKKYKEIEELKLKMYADGAIYASMTGSGSAVYGLFYKQ